MLETQTGKQSPSAHHGFQTQKRVILARSSLRIKVFWLVEKFTGGILGAPFPWRHNEKHNAVVRDSHLCFILWRDGDGPSITVTVGSVYLHKNLNIPRYCKLIAIMSFYLEEFQ